ncbi:MAG: NAD(P)H-binding protein [Gammaproteobacteria bacterium]|nr:NAD(P)H-binding protein [Gammaproteobacteria bacterium]
MARSISILGSGWLGLALAEHFVNQNYTVKASTRSENRFAEIRKIGAEPFKIDIEKLSTNLAKFLQSELLIVNITSKDLVAYQELIQAIEESPVKYVLFVSSTSVYENNNTFVKEDDGDEDLKSILYRIENLFRFNIHFKTAVIRFAGLVGYSRHPGKWFANKPVSQPDAPINLIHRDDCIGIIDAVIKQGAWDEVFNGCSSEHPTKREFYTHARQLLNLPAPEFLEDEEPDFKIVSNEKVIKELSYNFIYPDLLAYKEF